MTFVELPPLATGTFIMEGTRHADSEELPHENKIIPFTASNSMHPTWKLSWCSKMPASLHVCCSSEAFLALSVY